MYASGSILAHLLRVNLKARHDFPPARFPVGKRARSLQVLQDSLSNRSNTGAAPSAQKTTFIVFKHRVFWIDDPIRLVILLADFSDVCTVRANMRISAVGNRLMLLQLFVPLNSTFITPADNSALNTAVL